MFELIQGWLQRPNYIAFVLLFLWGIYIMVTRYNLVKKLIGMYLMQTSVIFFLVTTSANSMKHRTSSSDRWWDGHIEHR